MVKKTILFILGLSILVCAVGCSQRGEQSQTSDTPDMNAPYGSVSEPEDVQNSELENEFDFEAAKLAIRDGIERGYKVCRYIALAEFPHISTGYADPGIDGFYKLDYDFDAQDEYFKIVVDIMQDLKSVSDVERHYYDAFDTQTAEMLFSRLFTENYDMYKDIDGELYQNGQVSANPIRAYDWYVDDIEILEYVRIP